MGRTEQTLTKSIFTIRRSYEGPSVADTEPFVSIPGEGEREDAASIKTPYVFSRG